MSVNTVDLFGDEQTAAMLLEDTLEEYCDDTLSYIASYAFAVHKHLKSVTLTSSLTIGNDAFNNCWNLTGVSVPNLVSTQGVNAFANCFNLSSMVLPNIPFVLQGTFQNCYNLRYFDAPSARRMATALQNCLLLETITPATLQSISSCGSMPKCYNLKTIIMPSLSRVGNSMFMDDYSLSYASFENASMVQTSAFYHCISLSNLYLPSVKEIQTYAFGYCLELSSLDLPSLTKLSSMAFYGCINLTAVTIGGASVATLGGALFSTEINSKFTIYVPDSLVESYKTSTNWAVYSSIIKGMAEYSDTEPDFEILTSVSQSNYTGSLNIREIKLSDTLSLTCPFVGCLNLRSVTCDSLDKLTIQFSGCYNLKTINFPNLRRITATSAFRNCFALKSVSMPVVTSFQNGATFSSCCALQSIDLPLLQCVPYNAFVDCYTLSSVNLPNATIVSSSAFKFCSLLSCISLPMVSTIQASAFWGCHTLRTMILGRGAVCSISTTTFDSGYVSNLTVYVPDSLVESYKTSTNWAVYSSQIKPISELPESS